MVRHCSAEGQHRDSPLTSAGIRQARLVSKFFNDQNLAFDKIISSPYLRAIESIKPFAQNNNLQIEVNENLKERILSEEPIDDWLDVLEQSFIDLDFTLPGGESSNDAINRASIILDEILHNDSLSNVILVSHGNLISLLLKQYDNSFGFNKWKNLRNPDIYLIHMENNEHTVQCLWNEY
ncbi:histidine phosphatase family protein [Virgibacillus oceani]|nr:histidine phosphatase family protein [Virgibacillus oceani]